jgi:hypothetical protein
MALPSLKDIWLVWRFTILLPHGIRLTADITVAACAPVQLETSMQKTLEAMQECTAKYQADMVGRELPRPVFASHRPRASQKLT